MSLARWWVGTAVLPTIHQVLPGGGVETAVPHSKLAGGWWETAVPHSQLVVRLGGNGRALFTVSSWLVGNGRFPLFILRVTRHDLTETLTSD